MPMLKEPAATETPAEPVADPKEPSSSSTSTPSGGNATPVSGGSSAGSAAPSRAQADFEAKLEELATLDLSIKERQREIDIAKAKFDRLAPLESALPEGITPEMLAEAMSKLKAGDEVAFMRAVLRDKWSPEKLVAWADSFDAEELSVEDRVKRTLEAERKAEREAREKTEADAKAKEEEERLAREKTDADSADAELVKHLGGAADFFRTNQEKFPLAVRLDKHPLVDTEMMYRRILSKMIDETKTVPTHDQVFEAIEAEHRSLMDLAMPKKPDPVSEWDRLEAERKAAVAQPSLSRRGAAGGSGAKSGEEEAIERLLAWEREEAERAKLSYGR